jgi:hypothetical protein
LKSWRVGELESWGVGEGRRIKSEIPNAKSQTNSNDPNSKQMTNALSESKEPFFYSFYLILYSEPEGPGVCLPVT